MVEEQIELRGVYDTRVLAAMRTVRRHRFAPGIPPIEAYEDHPHPIGQGQTISQPYMVAWMSELADVHPPCKVLEVGTGSGYQAAVLAEMGCLVYSIEIVAPLAQQAEKILEAEGYGERVHVRAGDGYLGWPEQEPFDAVLVTAAAPRVPQPLLDQLRIGGKLVIPVGEGSQVLEVHTRTAEGFEHDRVGNVRFVPMTGDVRR
jgi:protein-L-isoaspartate(D-aspartate) O-methyltransferase